MLFNIVDIEFFIFVAIVIGVYWLFKNHLRIQKIWLLASCILFIILRVVDFQSLASRALDYMVFFAITLASICLNYWISFKLRGENGKKYLSFMVVFNVSILAYYKYFLFYIVDFTSMFNSMIVPIGLSFYTFSMIAYLSDIYREKYQPEKKFLNFLILL